MVILSVFLGGAFWISRSRHALTRGLGIGLFTLGLYFVLACASFLVRYGIVFPGMDGVSLDERRVALERIVVAAWLVILAGAFEALWLRKLRPKLRT